QLREMGVRRGDRVTVYELKSAAAIAGILGILEAGAAYVPIDPEAPPPRMRFIAQHCGARVLMSAGRPLERLQEVYDKSPTPSLFVPTEAHVAPGFCETVVRRSAGPPPAPPLSDPEHPSDSDLAYVLYTSGSTGAPQGVAVTHRQALSFVQPVARDLRLGVADVVASHAPLTLDLSVLDVFGTFAAGARLAVIPEQWLAFPDKVGTFVESHQISVWNSVASALVGLIRADTFVGRDISSLRTIIFAGEPMSWRHIRALRTQVPNAELVNIYGQTEAGLSCRYRVTSIPEHVDMEPLPIGRAFDNYDVLLLDQDGQLITEPNREGELLIVSTAVASGYWNAPERTNKSFILNPLQPVLKQGVYRTGDRAIYDARGQLVFRGRRDRLVKVKGYRLDLGEIESVAKAERSVDDAAVVAVPHPDIGYQLVLFAVCDASEAQAQFIRDQLARRLPRYMLPQEIYFLDRLPRTRTGRLDVRALEVAAAKHLESADDT
ncbi:MAG: amino acid adenylation domain-containing protein, partial [Myxococcota bacterium]